MEVFYNIVVFFKEEDGSESVLHIVDKNYTEYPSDEDILDALNKYYGDIVRVDKVYAKARNEEVANNGIKQSIGK